MCSSLVRLPSLHDYYACLVSWNKGALRGNCKQKQGSGCHFWYLWIGWARHPGPDSQGVAVEVFNVGGWLTHRDFALETWVDFLAVVEHRLIPARVRS